jgi:hypothetical protein
MDKPCVKNAKQIFLFSIVVAISHDILHICYRVGVRFRKQKRILEIVYVAKRSVSDPHSGSALRICIWNGDLDPGNQFNGDPCGSGFGARSKTLDKRVIFALFVEFGGFFLGGGQGPFTATL